MNKLAAVAMVGALTFGGVAQAEDLTLTVNLRSWHHVEGEYNEQNLGIGVERDHLRAGFYENSYSNTSVYVGAGYEHRVNEWFSVGADALLVSGYKEQHGYAITPLIAPNVSFGPEEANLKFYTVGAVSAVQARFQW